MNEIVKALEQAQAVIASAVEATSLGLLTDEDAVAVLGSVEALGRRVDGVRVAAASEIGNRSSSALGHDSLAWRNGCRGGVDLITQITRVSTREANRRLQLGAMVSARHEFTEILPPLFATVATALSTGELGVDAAEAIVTALQPASSRVDPASLETAERALVAAATGAIVPENEGLPGPVSPLPATTSAFRPASG